MPNTHPDRSDGTWRRHAAVRVTVAVLFAVAAHAIASPPAGGTFVMSRHVVASGGGQVTGGSYALNGTVGQAEAQGPVAGAGFVLTGGFHAPQAPAVPLPDPVFRDGFE